MSNKLIYDVVGIGNAIVDILSFVDEEFLTKHKLIKGSMALINKQDAEILSKIITPAQISAGGSASNSMIGISSLGGKSAFIGNVTNDEFGKLFYEDMKLNKVDFNSELRFNESPTAKCFIFITPDGERTMCTYLGAAPYIFIGEEEREFIKSAKIIYIESYLLDIEETRNLIKQMIILAKENGKKIALSLSDSFCVNRHKNIILEMIEESHIIFGNMSEILELTNSTSIDEAVNELSFDDKIFAITLGAQGSLILNEDLKVRIEAKKTNIVDLTGAGDFFASGFLFSHVIGGDLNRSATIGSIVASEIISHVGTRPATPLNKLIF